MRKKASIIIASFALLLVMCAPAAAGWEILYQGSGFGPTASYIQDNHMRQDMGNLVSIINVKPGTLTYINKARKTYWEGTPEEMVQSAESGVKSQMDQMLKGMPEGLRKKMQAAMKQKQEQPAGPKFEVKKTGRTEKIAGYTCTEYEVTSKGQKVMEMWLAPIDVASEIDIDRMTQTMSKMSARSGRSPMSAEDVVKLFKKGYPLKQVIHMGPQTSVTVAKSVRKLPLPGSTFAVPSGYKKAPAFMDVMH